MSVSLQLSFLLPEEGSGLFLLILSGRSLENLVSFRDFLNPF